MAKNPRIKMRDIIPETYDLAYARTISLLMVACVGLGGVMLLITVLETTFGISVLDLEFDPMLIVVAALILVVVGVCLGIINLWRVRVTGDAIEYRSYLGAKTTFAFADIDHAVIEHKRGNEILHVYVASKKVCTIDENMDNRAIFVYDLRQHGVTIEDK